MLIFLLAATAAITPPPAPQAPLGPTLWGDYKAGMPFDQARAIWRAQRRITIADGCVASLATGYDKKLLNSVQLQGSGSTEACRLIVTKSLKEKYGEPGAPTTHIIESSCGSSYGKWAALCDALGGNKSQVRTSYDWTRDGVAIDFTIVSDSADWLVTYTVDPQATAETVNKF